MLEAHGRAECSPSVGCDVSKFYKAIEAQLAAVKQQLELSQAAYSLGGQPAGDPLQGLTPEEFQKKLESMSQAEQVQFAMEYSRQQSVALAPEPPAVRAALDELRKLREQMGLQAAGELPDPFAEQFSHLQADIEREHEEIGEWANDNISHDASGLPGPEMEAVHAAAMQKHIAVEDDYHQALLIAFREEITRQKARFGPFQQKLAAIGYGENAINAKTRSDLVTGQQMMMDAAERLFITSRDATGNGARWWERKLETDRNSGSGVR